MNYNDLKSVIIQLTITIRAITDLCPELYHKINELILKSLWY